MPSLASSLRPGRRVLWAILAAGAVPPAMNAQRAPVDSGVPWVQIAVDRIGGVEALRRVAAVRLNYQTLWYRPSWSRTASGLEPFGSAEENVDVRDYTVPVWRMERRFGAAPGPAAIVNIVRDSVASSASVRGVVPLNAAYLDERRELFLMSPEWLLPRLLQDPARYAVRAGRDTSLDSGLLHTVSAVVDGISVSLWISRHGFLRGLRYHAAQPLDFGLAGLGEMEVRVYYDQWRETAGVALPWQVSVFRAGRLYKQLLMRGVEINPTIPAESLLVADTIRAAFTTIGRKAMTDIPHDSLVVVSEGIVRFSDVGTILGAVKLKQGWWLIGAGADSMQGARAVGRLTRDGDRVSTALLHSTSPTVLGGARVLADAGARFVVASASLGAARQVLGDREGRARPFQIVSGGEWMTIAGDSVWAEELSVPDAVGAVLLYVPRLKWAYLGPVGRGWPLRQALRVLDARGFEPLLIGTAQSVARPAAEVRQQAAPAAPPRR